MAVFEIDVNLELVRLQTRASLGDLALAGQRCSQAVGYAVGPRCGRNGEYELDHLIFIEVLSEVVEIGVIDISGMAR